MLVATITALLLIFGMGGGISYDVLDIIEEAQEVVEDRVDDKDRQAELLTLLKQMELETRTFTSDLRSHRKDLLTLDLNPNSTREEYMMVFRRLDARWVSAEETLMDQLFEFRNRFSPEEWQEIHAEIQAGVQDDD